MSDLAKRQAEIIDNVSSDLVKCAMLLPKLKAEVLDENSYDSGAHLANRISKLCNIVRDAMSAVEAYADQYQDSNYSHNDECRCSACDTWRYHVCRKLVSRGTIDQDGGIPDGGHS